MRRIAALILAAGRGTRFGAGAEDSKVTALLDGKPLVRHVAEAALSARTRPVVVVTGHAAARVETVLAGLDDVTFVHNPAYPDGLSTSVKAGVAALPVDVDGAIILLADMPRVTAQLIDKLIHAFETADPAVLAVAPTYAGQRGNPVLVARCLFAAVAAVTGDRGARGLLDAAGQDLLELAVEDAGVGFDIDTRGALAAASTRLS